MNNKKITIEPKFYIILITTIIILSFVCLIVFVIPNTQAPIIYKKITLENNVKGFLVRDEKVISIKYPVTYTLDIFIDQDTYVTARDTIGILYPNTNNNIIEYLDNYNTSKKELYNYVYQQYNIIKLKIADGTYEGEPHQSLIERIDTLNDEIYILSNSLQSLLQTEHYEEIANTETIINEKLDERLNLMLDIIGENEYIYNLYKSIEHNQTVIDENVEYKKTLSSGIFSYRLDGYENTVSLNSLDLFTVDNANDIINNSSIVFPEEEENTLTFNYKIYSNDCLYYVCVLANEFVTEQNLSSYKICFKTDTDLDAKIYRTDSGKNETMLIFSIENESSLIEYQRILPAIIKSEYEGYTVPYRSIKENNTGKYIVVKENDSKTKVYIDLIAATSTTAVFKPINNSYTFTENSMVLYND